jgi:hypothetical protein
LAAVVAAVADAPQRLRRRMRARLLRAWLRLRLLDVLHGRRVVAAVVDAAAAADCNRVTIPFV